MMRYLGLMGFCLLCGQWLQAQELVVNKGVAITGTGEVLIRINGDYVQKEGTGKQICFDTIGGILEVKGAVINQSSQALFDPADKSQVLLLGEDLQDLGISSGVNGTLNFNRLVLQKPQVSDTIALQQDISVKEQLIFGQGNLFLNGKTLRLDAPMPLTSGVPMTTLMINERPNSRVLDGEGEVRFEANVNNSFLNGTEVNYGNLGSALNSNGLAGLLVIKRGFDTQINVNGGNSINRYFDVQPAAPSGLDADYQFQYFPGELNGHAADSLAFFRSLDEGANWQFVGADTLDPANFLAEKRALDSLSYRWTLFPCEDLSQVEIGSDTIRACAADTLVLNAGPGGVLYNWSNGQSGQIILVPNPMGNQFGDTLRLYVDVSSASDCMTRDSVVVIFQEQPVVKLVDQAQPLMELGPSITLCPGTDLTLDPGSGNYQYQWFPTNQTTRFQTVSDPGLYIVTASLGACSAADTLTVNQHPEILALELIESVACHGEDSGRIDLMVLNGQGPFSYQWFAGNVLLSPADSFLIDVGAGYYRAEITDASGCTLVMDSLQVEEPATPLDISTTVSQSFCGQATGEISLSISGGEPSYHISWSNGAVGLMQTDLAAGLYTIQISDQAGCERTILESISDQGAADITLLTQKDISCFGFADGTLDLQISGGTAPLDILWTNGETQTDLTNVPAGQYGITVTGSDNCVSSANFTLRQPDPLQLTAQVFDEGCKTAADGRIEVFVTGGSSPYEYIWSTGAQAPPPLVGLSAGTYTLEVLDAQQCALRDTFELDSLPSPLLPRFLAPSPVFALDSVRLIDVSYPKPQSWKWDFDLLKLNPVPNPATSLEPNPIVLFPEDPSPGSPDFFEYQVQLWVETEHCVDSVVKTIRVKNEAQKKADEYLTHSLTVNELQFQRLVAYPNPTSGELTVEIELTEIADVELLLLDLSGRQVDFLSLQGSSVYAPRLHLSALAEGMYMIRATVGEQVRVLKIMLLN